jgi:hypothetical protein
LDIALGRATTGSYYQAIGNGASHTPSHHKENPDEPIQ